MCKLRNNGGFTLVEILIAIVILTIGTLGVATLTVSIIRGNAFSNRLTTATTLAQDRMEQLKKLGFAGSAALTENYGNITDFAPYKRVTTVFASTPATGMITVTVTVFWDSDARSVALSTIIGE